MRRSRGFVHPVARRVALASMTVLATSGIGMIAGPAVGQIVIPIGGPILGGSSQGATVTNAGSASANTGGNTAIGNNSQNNATSTQQVSGGLLGVGVTLGGPTNNSTGTATINAGAANAVGNSASTNVGQSAQGGRHPVIVPKGHVAAKHHAVHHPRTLARTGLDSADLGMIGGALLGAGMLLVASQRRRLAARHAAVPMAGFGMGLGADEWDRPVR